MIFFLLLTLQAINCLLFLTQELHVFCQYPWNRKGNLLVCKRIKFQTSHILDNHSFLWLDILIENNILICFILIFWRYILNLCAWDELFLWVPTHFKFYFHEIKQTLCQVKYMPKTMWLWCHFVELGIYCKFREHSLHMWNLGFCPWYQSILKHHLMNALAPENFPTWSSSTAVSKSIKYGKWHR